MINTKQFLSCIKTAAKIAAKNGVQPVLSNVLLEVDNNYLKITTTDLTESYTKTLILSGEQESFKTTVNAAFLFKILSGIKDNYIDFIIDNDIFRIRTNKTDYLLRTIPATEFPRNMLFDNDYIKQLSVHSDVLKKLYKTASQDTDNVLGSVGIDTNGQLCTTDGNRLLYYKTEQLVANKFNISTNIIPFLTTGNYNISTFDDNVKLLNTDTNEVFYTKLIDGTYPVYMKLIPCHNDIEINFNTKELIKALNEIKVTLNSRINIVKMLFKNNNIYLQTEIPEDGKTKTKIGFTGDISKLKYTEIGLNWHYLKDFAETTDSLTLELHPSGNLDGILIKFTDNNYTGVLMPIQLN